MTQQRRQERRELLVRKVPVDDKLPQGVNSGELDTEVGRGGAEDGERGVVDGGPIGCLDGGDPRGHDEEDAPLEQPILWRALHTAMGMSRPSCIRRFQKRSNPQAFLKRRLE